MPQKLNATKPNSINLRYQRKLLSQSVLKLCGIKSTERGGIFSPAFTACYLKVKLFNCPQYCMTSRTIKPLLFSCLFKLNP